MNDGRQVDYIIVGQGLAGSAVAINLLKRGRSVMVFDQPQKNRASRVAAGLFNPVTGQNNVRTWLAAELFESLNRFYSSVESLTKQKFFFPSIIYRPFSGIAEQNDWMARSADPAYISFIEKIATSPSVDAVHDPFGGLYLRQGGFLRTTTYLDAVRNYLEQKRSFRDEYFDADSLIVEQSAVRYKEWQAQKVIFCQGDHTVANRWFSKLPVRPLKGETLLIKTSWKEHVILNRGVYMVPEIQPDEFRVGATYKFNDRSEGVSAEGQRELEEKLMALISAPFEIIGKDWGIRATTNDRRPLIGSHPEFPRLMIFNGLGTKGVSLAPYFSEVMIHWVENTGTLNKEVALTRFK